MTVSLDSRYAGVPTQLVLTADRGSVVSLYPGPARPETSARTVISIEGDTFEIFAWRLYQDPRMYWRIADLNPHVFFPGEIPAGTFLRIPLT